MKLLILGGAGFLGANCARYFCERGHRVAVMDNLVRRGSEINLAESKRLGIPFHHGDVRNREDFIALPRDFDFVLDCSAQTSATDGYANPTFDLTNNTVGLLNALEYARGIGAAFIFCSTNRVFSADRINAFPVRETATRWVWDAARAKPVRGFDLKHGFSQDFDVDGAHHSIYGLSKICADLICQEWARAFDLPLVVNRFGLLSGPGQFGKCTQGWVAWWAIAGYFNLPLQYIGWKGKQVRDILFAEDACRLFELEMKRIHKVAGQVFTTGGGAANSLSLREATEVVGRLWGRTPKPAMVSKPRMADFVIYWSDNRKAERLLGWKPKISIEEGYRQIGDWVRREETKLRALYV